MKNHTLPQLHLVATDTLRIGQIVRPFGGSILAFLEYYDKEKYIIRFLSGNTEEYEDKPTCYELHLTSDEDIKEGDWLLQTIHKGQSNESTIIAKMVNQKYNIKEDTFEAQEVDGSKFSSGRHYERKIIATTNKELWGMFDGKQIHRGTGVAKIPNDLIELYIKSYNEEKPIEKVWLQLVRNFKQVEGGLHLGYHGQVAVNVDGSVIWSLGEEKMYTQQDIEDAFLHFGTYFYNEYSNLTSVSGDKRKQSAKMIVNDFLFSDRYGVHKALKSKQSIIHQ